MQLSCDNVILFPPTEEISVANLRRVPNSDETDANNVTFAFEVNPSIDYEGTLTYSIRLNWEEEVRGYTGSSNNYYYRAQSDYSRQCHKYGSLRISAQTYQFSVSKSSLGSGPLYVNVSVSFVCNESTYHYYYYRRCSNPCYTWQYKGDSNTIRTDSFMVRTYAKGGKRGRVSVLQHIYIMVVRFEQDTLSEQSMKVFVSYRTSIFAVDEDLVVKVFDNLQYSAMCFTQESNTHT